MKRAIDVEEQVRDGGEEGLCYNPTLARMEGLYEEVLISSSTDIEDPDIRLLKISPEAAFELAEQLELGVNVGPGERQIITITVAYVYDYGRIEETAEV